MPQQCSNMKIDSDANFVLTLFAFDADIRLSAALSRARRVRHN